MYFKRLYMHGFKSFAEPVTVEFHPGITCIVGPNGSGKSNISDAIRWVLGEQSPKMLRGGKMQEVIFAGTQNRKSRGMAEVILTIDNSEGILPIEYNEVAITRRMYRSGESEYYINSNQCRLKDIRELIMDTGIGVDGYSIIGQGKIADIISNKTESRREIFEEAAGVVMYRSKKAEAERKLDNASGNLDRVNDIIGEIEDRIDDLREDSRKASEYVTLRDRYKDLEINITIRNVEGAEEKLKELADELKDIRISEMKLSDAKDSADKQASKIKAEISTLDELLDDSRKKLLETINSMGELTNKMERNEEKLISIEENRHRIGEELKEFENRFDAENDNIRSIEKNLQSIEKKYTNAKESLDEKTSLFEEKTREVSETLADVDAMRNSIFSHHQNASAKRTEADGLRRLDKTLSDREKQIEEDKTVEVSGIDREEENRLKEKRDETARAIDSLKEESRKLQEEYEKKSRIEKNIAVKLETLRIDSERISARKKTIEEMESNYEGYNGAVKYIMKQNRKGIYGTVAELMQVPSGMEIAVETALGAGLQNIICMDDRAAKEAVLLLKREKAGRLTFIPVSSVRSGKTSEDLSGYKGFLGLGADIISFDEKYKAAYEYLLGRTVIVDNMDNAVAMSKKTRAGLRFVTVDGEVVSGAGTITGGRYRNKTANLLARKSEIESLSAKFEELKKEYDETKKSRENILDEMSDTVRETSEKESRIRELEKELTLQDGKLSALKAEISASGNRIQKWDEEIRTIREQKKQALDMVEELERDADEEEAKALAAEESIDSIQSRYDQAKVELEEISEEITQARIVVTSCEEEKRGIENLRKRIREAIDEITESIDIREEQLTELEEQKEQITSQDENNAQIMELEEEKKRLTEIIEKASDKKVDFSKTSEEILENQKQIERDLSVIGDRAYSADIKKAKLETQLESIKERLWEAFEITYAEALTHRSEDFVMSRAVKENREIKQRMTELGDVNIKAIEEYKAVSERYGFLTEQREDILSSMDDLHGIISDMDKTIRLKFKEAFDNVSVKFEEVFRDLFGGGSAQLVLVNPENPLESDIDIVAQPPGKKLQNINLLSGGEKTMTAIAMMFAVLKTKPTPFCILDEVEAALDDANIERFSSYLKTFDRIQFALVTHQKATMEHANVLYGVTMPEQGVSKLLSLRMGDEFQI